MMKKILLFGLLFLLIQNLSAQETPDDVATDASQFSLFPNNIIVTPGAVVNLHIYYEPANKPGKITTLGASQTVAEWTINGHSIDKQDATDGHLSTALDFSATYKAPSSAPSHNPVIITVTFIPYLLDTTKRTKITLYASIKILDEPNYFYIGASNKGNISNSETGDGNLYLVKEPFSQGLRQSSETAVQANDQWNIHVNGIDANGEQLTIQANFTGNGVGSYPWQVEYTNEKGIYQATGASVFALGGNAGSIHYISTDCEPHGKDDCKGITLPGTITIKTFDTKNKIMRGYFYGQMRNGEQYMFVSGGFSVFMR